MPGKMSGAIGTYPEFHAGQTLGHGVSGGSACALASLTVCATDWQATAHLYALTAAWSAAFCGERPGYTGAAKSESG
jgi:hypothetical protein